MTHLYLFTLEIVPLEVGRVYTELPSHLTLMSRFWSDLPANRLAAAVRPLFTQTPPFTLRFGKTVELGPKRLMVHLVDQPAEQTLHNNLHSELDAINAQYQYPEFIGTEHKPHVTKREGIEFKSGGTHVASAAYLIEVIEGKRVVRTKFEFQSK